MAKPTRLSIKDADLLPYFCEPQGIFGLIIASELLALGIVLVSSPIQPFPWTNLGITSLIVLWISLSSATILCNIRSLLRRLPRVVSGMLAYTVVLLVAGLVLFVGRKWLLSDFDVLLWLRDIVVAAIFSGIWLRFFYLQQELRIQQQAELQARIQSLQARIRPHFLFNSMNTIASLISIDPDSAEKVVEDLSELFRASLQEASLVPLSEELSLCKSYVAIEQVRLGKRLSVSWECDDIPASVEIPRLSLQPLIENAIYHGITGLPEGGVVEVVLRRVESSVFIQVRNPFPSKLTAAAKTQKGNQVAMENISHRLHAYFGNKASLLVQIHPGDTIQDYFLVTISLPLLQVNPRK